MSVFSNINKVAKSFYSNVLNMGEESFKIGKTLKSDENILEINPQVTLSFWDSSVSYKKNDRVLVSVVNSDNEEIFKIYKAKSDVKSDISPDTDTENWEESDVQISNLPEGLKEEVAKNTASRHSHSSSSLIQYAHCTTQDELARLDDGMYYVVFEKEVQQGGGHLTGSSGATLVSGTTTYTYNFWLFAKIYTSVRGFGVTTFVGSTNHTQTAFYKGKFYTRTVTVYSDYESTVEYTEWELLGSDTYATKTEIESLKNETEEATSTIENELENYVKKDDYSGINSLAYFFADNLNNGLFGKIETSGALMCDYIFKNNSMSEIEVDLSNCVSMVGGFLNSTVEKVTFTNGTPKLQKANNLFRGCTKLTEVSGLDLTNCDNVKYLFMNCESLTEIPYISTNATDLSYMFMNCKSLETISLYTPNLGLATGMFNDCDSLKTITIKEKTDFEKLFNALPTVESGNITVDCEISEEIKKIATDKGWTI